MGAYLDAISFEVWKATKEGYDENPTLDQVHVNAKARNAILECISFDVFARISNINCAHKMWKELSDFFEGSTKVKELKYHRLKFQFDIFTMLGNELCYSMYSRLNILVKELNRLGMEKIEVGTINRKILMLLPKPRYNIIAAMLHK
jgi:hypothetical protein